jgi:hypothetical protein
MHIIRVLAASVQKQRVGAPFGTRLIAVRPELSAAGIVFRHQPFLGIQKIGAFAVDLLPQPPAKGVVSVLRDHGLRQIVFHLDEPIRDIVAVVHRGCSNTFLNQIPVVVVVVLNVRNGQQFVIVGVRPGSRNPTLSQTVVGALPLIRNGDTADKDDCDREYYPNW